MKKTAIDSEAFLIEIEVQGEVFRVLWGVIAVDETGRWRPGDYVCTTPIQNTEELDEGVTRFVTRSGRLYETTCPVQPHKAKSATEFRFFLGRHLSGRARIRSVPGGAKPTERPFWKRP